MAGREIISLTSDGTFTGKNFFSLSGRKFLPAKVPSYALEPNLL